MGCRQSSCQEKPQQLTSADDALQIGDPFVQRCSSIPCITSTLAAAVAAVTPRPAPPANTMSAGPPDIKDITRKPAAAPKQPQTNKSRCLPVRSARLPRTDAARPVS